GEPFDRSPMTNAPVNELGVMVLFGMVAASLGLQVESVQGKFPDCVAKRLVAPGKWQHLRIEFEYESKNFKLHGHDPKGCDMIVCWAQLEGVSGGDRGGGTEQFAGDEIESQR